MLCVWTLFRFSFGIHFQEPVRCDEPNAIFSATVSQLLSPSPPLFTRTSANSSGTRILADVVAGRRKTLNRQLFNSTATTPQQPRKPNLTLSVARATPTPEPSPGAARLHQTRHPHLLPRPHTPGSGSAEGNQLTLAQASEIRNTLLSGLPPMPQTHQLTATGSVLCTNENNGNAPHIRPRAGSRRVSQSLPTSPRKRQAVHDGEGEDGGATAPLRRQRSRSFFKPCTATRRAKSLPCSRAPSPESGLSDTKVVVGIFNVGGDAHGNSDVLSAAPTKQRAGDEQGEIPGQQHQQKTVSRQPGMSSSIDDFMLEMNCTGISSPSAASAGTCSSSNILSPEMSAICPEMSAICDLSGVGMDSLNTTIASPTQPILQSTPGPGLAASQSQRGSSGGKPNTSSILDQLTGCSLKEASIVNDAVDHPQMCSFSFDHNGLTQYQVKKTWSNPFLGTSILNASQSTRRSYRSFVNSSAMFGWLKRRRGLCVHNEKRDRIVKLGPGFLTWGKTILRTSGAGFGFEINITVPSQTIGAIVVSEKTHP